MDILSLKNVGPYMGVQMDEKVSKMIDGVERNFRLVLYGAYNAFGLIGSESNGIVVLDEDKLAVVSDELGCEASGYFGASESQKRLFEKLAQMDGEAFKDFVNSKSRRLRYEI